MKSIEVSSEKFWKSVLFEITKLRKSANVLKSQSQKELTKRTKNNKAVRAEK